MIIMDPHILRRSLRIIVKLRDLLAMTPRNPVVIVRSVVEAAVTKVVVVVAAVVVAAVVE